jgi:hypothetical protein
VGWSNGFPARPEVLLRDNEAGNFEKIQKHPQLQDKADIKDFFEILAIAWKCRAIPCIPSRQWTKNGPR